MVKCVIVINKREYCKTNTHTHTHTPHFSLRIQIKMIECSGSKNKNIHLTRNSDKVFKYFRKLRQCACKKAELCQMTFQSKIFYSVELISENLLIAQTCTFPLATSMISRFNASRAISPRNYVRCT